MGKHRWWNVHSCMKSYPTDPDRSTTAMSAPFTNSEHTFACSEHRNSKGLWKYFIDSQYKFDIWKETRAFECMSSCFIQFSFHMRTEFIYQNYIFRVVAGEAQFLLCVFTYYFYSSKLRLPQLIALRMLRLLYAGCCCDVSVRHALMPLHGWSSYRGFIRSALDEVTLFPPLMSWNSTAVGHFFCS